MDPNDQDWAIHCECGKTPLNCHAELCEAEWLPVIYIEPDWPNEPEQED